MQQLKDGIVQARVHGARDAFIAAIPERRVCALASFCRGGEPCHVFQPFVRGSYNVCYFVRFDGDGERWVVRVPLEPCLAAGGASKLESEVATMQLVSERTTIPVPAIKAYALGNGPAPLSSFLILEYIDGLKISHAQFSALSDEQRTRLYTSIADIHIQLRRLEFPSIGCLTRGPAGAQVSKKVLTMDMNMQETEGLRPSVIRDSYYSHRHGRLASANAYTEMLLEIAGNAFVEGRSSVTTDDGMGESLLFHLDVFRQLATHWVDPRLDRGPFVLVHGDFELYNLLLNDRMEVVSVLDWEWSRVVPLQYFRPPLWLKNPLTTYLAYEFMYKAYLKQFWQLLQIVEARERERFGSAQLAGEWAKAKEDSGFLVANALENWTDIDWFAVRYVAQKWFRGKQDVDEHIKAFMEADPARVALVQRKVREGVKYEAELSGLKDTGEK